MDNQEFIQKLRENIPLEVEHEDPHAQLREFSQLLLIFPLVVIIIFGCSQLALFSSSTPALAKASSSLTAEYSPWQYIPITGLRSGIIDEIRADSAEEDKLVEAYNAPVAVASTWIHEPPPPIVVAQLPTEDPPTLPPDDDDVGAGGTPTVEAAPSPTILVVPTEEPTPTDAESTQSTETPAATSTENSPTESGTSEPTTSSEPTPTHTATDTATQLPTPTSSPTDTPPPTETPVPTETPTSPPPDYCANISYNKVRVNKQRSSPNRLWKFYLEVYNHNTISMYLTSYQVSWSNDSDLHLNRAKAIPNPDTGVRATLHKKKEFSPSGSCLDCPVEFVPQPVSYDAEIYNMFCNDYPCTEDNPQNDIPPGTYNFTAKGVFTFYPPGGGTVSCSFSKSASITH